MSLLLVSRKRTGEEILDKLVDILDERDRLRSHIAALREALEPLAAAAEAVERSVDTADDAPIWMSPTKLTAGDARRARAALRTMDEASRG